MAKIVIEREHGLGSAQAAKEKVLPIEGKLKDKYGVSFSWSGDRASIKGKGVTGEFIIDHSCIRIELKLGMLLTPLTKKIQESIERSIEKTLAQK